MRRFVYGTQSVPTTFTGDSLAAGRDFGQNGGLRTPPDTELAMFEQIETMKRQYTDKYVVVDATRPELARFRDVVGRVKTVNMSGRALVEFDDYHLNIGWYDIDPAYLKVVDKPPPKAPKEEKKAAPKAAAKPAAAKPAAAGKGSVADILAAARAGKAAAKPAGETAKAGQAAGEAAKPAAPAKVDRSKMSVAEMLAAARGQTAAKAAPAKPAAEETPAAEEPTAPAKKAEAAAAPAPSSGEIKRIDKSKMSIADIIAYCREHDAK